MASSPRRRAASETKPRTRNSKKSRKVMAGQLYRPTDWLGPQVKGPKISATVGISTERLAQLTAVNHKVRSTFEREFVHIQTGEIRSQIDEVLHFDFAGDCDNAKLLRSLSERQRQNLGKRDDVRNALLVNEAEFVRTVRCRKCRPCKAARFRRVLARALEELKVQGLAGFDAWSFTVTVNPALRAHIIDCLLARYYGHPRFESVEALPPDVSTAFRKLAGDGLVGRSIVDRFRTLWPEVFYELALPYVKKDWDEANDRIRHREKRGELVSYRHLISWEMHPGKKAVGAQIGWPHGHAIAFLHRAAKQPGYLTGKAIEESLSGISRPRLLTGDGSMKSATTYAIKYLLKDGGDYSASKGFGLRRRKINTIDGPKWSTDYLGFLQRYRIEDADAETVQHLLDEAVRDRAARRVARREKEAAYHAS